jgi:hypothetical protein
MSEREGLRERLPISYIVASLSVAAVVLGYLWDYSWDATIGKDSFWSPPHLLSYVGGLLAGLTGVALVFRSAVRPIGAWFLVWGSVAMQAASLLDPWWQTAYGFHGGSWLGPPQALLTAGTLAIHAGALLLIASWQNRTGRSSIFFALTGGMLLAFLVSLNTEVAWPNLHHTGLFYEVMALLLPIALVALARSGAGRFGATFAALVYMTVLCLLVWLLPLFPAKPLLGPIYYPIDHLLPPIFPLILVAPALAIDGLARRRELSSRTEWVWAAACGLAFLAIFAAIQWPFASFLLSSSADTWFFAGGGKHWPFYFQVGDGATTFWGLTKIPMTAQAAVIAALLAIVSARIGWWWGDWMGAVRR